MTSNIVIKLPKLPKVVRKTSSPKIFSKKELGEKWVKCHQGPTDFSNWIIPNVVLISKYPFSKNIETGKKMIKTLLEEGIRCFVNLIEDKEMSKLVDYKKYTINIHKSLNKDSKEEISFLRLQIPDNSIPSIKEASKLIQNIISHIKDHNKVLIHCFAGSGRAGTIAGILIGELFQKLKYSQIMKRIQAAHDSRVEPNICTSPLSVHQFVRIATCIGEDRVDYKKYSMVSENNNYKNYGKK